MTTSHTTKTTHSTWTGMVAIEDTALAVTDTGGSGVPIVYLNGAYADQRHWQKVIDGLGRDYRHISFDERARGKSKRSADYTFDAGMRDIDAVLRARDIQQPVVLVGWSYGALLAVRWAAQHPNEVLGVVGVDGPFPAGWTDEAHHEQIRKLFNRLRWFIPILRRMGMAARMTAKEHADVAIEAHMLHASLGSTLEHIAVPVHYVIASGAHTGDDNNEMDKGRATLNPLLDRNPHLVVSAKVASNHEKVLKKDSPAVVKAIREVLAITKSKVRQG